MGLIKNTIHTIVFQFINQALGICSGILLARLMGPEGKGIMSIFQANASFFSMLILFNLNKGMIYFGSSDEKLQLKIFNSVVAIVIILTAILASVLFASSYFHISVLSGFVPPKYDSFLYLAYVVYQIFLSAVLVLFLSLFQGRENFKQANWIDFSTSLISLMIYAGLFAYSVCYEKQFDLYIFFLVTVATSSIQLVIWAYLTYRNFGDALCLEFIDLPLLKRIFNYSSLYFAGGILSFLIHRLDFWFVSYYRGQEQLGYYSLATNVAGVIFVITGSLFTVLFPRLSKMQDASEKLDIISRICRITVCISFFFCAFLYFVSSHLIPILYGKRFLPAVLPFNVMLGGTFMLSITSIIAAYFSGSGLVKYNLRSASIGVLATIPLDIVLIPRYGIIGAAIATTVSFSVVNIYACLVFYSIRRKFDFLFINFDDVVVLRSALLA